MTQSFVRCKCSWSAIHFLFPDKKTQPCLLMVANASNGTQAEWLRALRGASSRLWRKKVDAFFWFHPHGSKYIQFHNRPPYAWVCKRALTEGFNLHSPVSDSPLSPPLPLQMHYGLLKSQKRQTMNVFTKRYAIEAFDIYFLNDICPQMLILKSYKNSNILLKILFFFIKKKSI